MPLTPPPIPHPNPPLSQHQLTTLALLLRRAIANSQLILHQEALDAEGDETEQGPSVAAEDWPAEVGAVDFSDGAPARQAVHIYISAADVDTLCGAED